MTADVVEYAMNKIWKVVRSWNPLVIVLEHSRFSFLATFIYLSIYILCFLCCFSKVLSLCTFQFAHRDCIQRWCEEKGNTTCEICLKVLILFSFFFIMIIVSVSLSFFTSCLVIRELFCWILQVCVYILYKLRKAKDKRTSMLLSKFHVRLLSYSF